MKITTHALRYLSALVLLGTVSCAEDGDGADDAADTDNADGADNGSDGGVDEQCDPVGSNPEMNALINAPVAADVEVIEKVPQHPGPAGPAALP